MRRSAVLALLSLGCAGLFLSGPPAQAQMVGSTLETIGSVDGGMAAQRNQPYTLVQQTTMVRTLADGTRITEVRQETHVRDAEGRTRTDVTQVSPATHAFPIVHITDPVQRTVITLFTNAKQASVYHLSEPSPEALQRRQAARARMSGTGTPAVVGGASAAAADATQPRMQREVETLAPRTIAGLVVEGRRITRVIPAGREGNDHDITAVSEIWTSPDLRVVLERTIDDPRSGKQTMTTTSLERASPDPALFQVPPDYHVTNNTQQTKND